MDSRDGNVQQNHPTLCRNGCGFYSAAGNEGLCSVCYKDLVKKKQAPPTNMPATLAPTPGSMASLSIEEGSNSNSSFQSAAVAAAAAANSASNISAAAAAFGGSAAVASSSSFGGAVAAAAAAAATGTTGAGSTVAAAGAGGASSSLETGSTTMPTVPDRVDELGSAGAATSSAGGADGDNGENKDGKKKKNRCLTCKKKVGLTGFTCRCGGLFCSIHRYSDKHVCGFDYKALGAEEISKSNPVVVAEKVAKI